MGARSRHVRFMLIGWIIILGSVTLLAACSHSPSPQPRISGAPSSTSTEPPLLRVSGLSLDNYRTQANVIVAVDRSRSMDALWDGWRGDVQNILSKVLEESGGFQLILYPAEEEGMAIKPIRVHSPNDLPPIETSRQARNGYLDALDVISDNIKAGAQNIVIWVTDGSFHYENGRRDASEAEEQSAAFRDNFEEAWGAWKKNGYNSISIYVFGYIDEDQFGEHRRYESDWNAWKSWMDEEWLSREGWLYQAEFYKREEEKRNIAKSIENVFRSLCPRGAIEISYDNYSNTLLCNDENGNKVNCGFTSTQGSTVEGYASSFNILVCEAPLVTVQWGVDIRPWKCREEKETETAVVSIEIANGWNLQEPYDKMKFRVLDGPQCAQAIARKYQQSQCEEAEFTNTGSHMSKSLQNGVCARGDEGLCYDKIKGEYEHEIQLVVPMDIVKQCAFEVQIGNNQVTISLLLKRLFEGEENGH